jgi:spore photoproduct lyase
MLEPWLCHVSSGKISSPRNIPSAASAPPVNTDIAKPISKRDLEKEIHQLLTSHPNQFYRIGSGELSDSMIFDHFANFSHFLVPIFAEKQNAILELKSKTDEVDNVLNLKHNRRVVMSWSLNTEEMAAKEEPFAPSIDDRIEAARAAQDAGYWIGFHFDPLLDYSDWENGYRQTVDKIFKYIKPRNIAWISLGALRYPSSFDEIIRERQPQSSIVQGELFPGRDGKLRYFRPIRVEMFKKMHRWITGYSTEFPVYLCMESDVVWRQAFGWSPKTSAGLKKYLDDRVR